MAIGYSLFNGAWSKGVHIRHEPTGSAYLQVPTRCPKSVSSDGLAHSSLSSSLVLCYLNQSLRLYYNMILHRYCVEVFTPWAQHNQLPVPTRLLESLEWALPWFHQNCNFFEHLNVGEIHSVNLCRNPQDSFSPSSWFHQQHHCHNGGTCLESVPGWLHELTNGTQKQTDGHRSSKRKRLLQQGPAPKLRKATDHHDGHQEDEFPAVEPLT